MIAKIRLIFKAIKEAYNREKAINYFVVEAEKIKGVSFHKAENIVHIETYMWRRNSREQPTKIREKVYDVELRILELFPDVPIKFSIINMPVYEYKLKYLRQIEKRKE